MDNPIDMRFTHWNEWVVQKGDTLVLGVTDYGQSHLGDIVHVELPEPDEHAYRVDEDIGGVESLTGSIELHAPVAGTITGINFELLSHPEIINSDPYGRGWICEMKPDDMSGLDELMDVNEYESGLPDNEEEE